MIKPDRRFLKVVLTGEEEAVEDLILDLQGEFPEWFVLNVKHLVLDDGHVNVVLAKEIKDDKEQ